MRGWPPRTVSWAAVLRPSSGWARHTGDASDTVVARTRGALCLSRLSLSPLSIAPLLFVAVLAVFAIGVLARVEPLTLSMEAGLFCDHPRASDALLAIARLLRLTLGTPQLARPSLHLQLRLRQLISRTRQLPSCLAVLASPSLPAVLPRCCVAVLLPIVRLALPSFVTPALLTSAFLEAA